MARIAVLGGTVFLGGHAISRLLADGHEVRAIGRSPEGRTSRRASRSCPAMSPCPGPCPLSSPESDGSCG